MSRMARVVVALLVSAVPLWAQTGTLAPQPKFIAYDANGDPINNGKLCTYVSGTATPATTYTDSGLMTANANPTRTDSAGRADVWLIPGQAYKFVLRTAGADNTCATGTIQWTVDGIGAVPSSSANLDVLGTAGEALTAGQVVYLSDGSGSKTAGQWFKATSDTPYASAGAVTGLVPNSIVSGSVGSIRLGGQATGLSGLSVGSTYYVAATPGALTATAPTTRRAVGVADTTSTLILIGAQPTQALAVPLGLNEFRLSLTTGVSVTTADVTGASAVTVFLVPHTGNRIALYDASGNPTIYTSAEISIAVPATTSTLYDVWAYASSSGVPTLELLAWTNDTTRATAIVKTVAPGVWTKSGDATRRYLGSMRTTGVSGQTEDSLAKRYLWNFYHRADRAMRVLEATASWTYTLGAWQQARATATNQLDVVIGVADAFVDVSIHAAASNTNANIERYVGIGYDTVAGPTAGMLTDRGAVVSSVAAIIPLIVSLKHAPAVGRHFYAWLEYSIATGTTTWYGTSGGASFQQSGIEGVIRN